MINYIDRKSFLWAYLQPELQELLNDGELLVNVAHDKQLLDKVDDFSFLVFPFAKAYEGFLKKLLLDIGMIHYDDYYGDDIRIGRVLNPHYQHENVNVFAKLCKNSALGKDLPDKLWNVWTNGRNLIFHYFPHNYKKLTYDEAQVIINSVIEAMNLAVLGCGLNTLQLPTTTIADQSK